MTLSLKCTSHFFQNIPIMSDYINKLSDEQLVKIFNNLPLCQVIRLELVSRRWKEVQELALSRFTTLTLYHDKFPWDYHDFFQLSFFKVSLKICKSRLSSCIICCCRIHHYCPKYTATSLHDKREAAEGKV